MMGEVHARTLHDSVRDVAVTCVHDADVSRAGEVAASIGARVSTTPEELVGEVDAVVIASPDGAHATQAVLALAHGCFVMCEKPLATTAAEVLAVVDAELAIGQRRLQVGLMREFDPGHAAIAAAVRSGELGDTVVTRSTHLNPRPWLYPMPAERAITQSMIHDIHSVRFLSGAEVLDVDVDTVVEPANGSVRYVSARLRMSDGSIGIIDLSVGTGYGYRVDAEVVGTIATMATTDPASTTLWREGRAEQVVPDNWPERFATTYRDELVAWIDSLRNGVSVGATAWDGYVANLVAEACVASAETRRRVDVSIPERPSFYDR